MTKVPLIAVAAVFCTSCGGAPAPVQEPAPVPEPEIETEIEVEAPPQLDEASKVLQVEGMGGFVVVEAGFSSFEGDRCIITLDSAGNLVTSVSLHSGFSCPYEQGQWKVDPEKVKELVQLLNDQGSFQPAVDPGAGKHLDFGTKLHTDQGGFEVVPQGKVDPVEEYLHGLYESR
ncbi:MAG: hypothetical protein JRG91_08245 [Deltaproteobacteria bacterium]|nr:hypothetical protein [Deltaproteobacteria bacterium]